MTIDYMSHNSVMNGSHVHCDLSAMFRTMNVPVQDCVTAISLAFWCLFCTPVEQATALAAFCFQACARVTACFLAGLSCPAIVCQQPYVYTYGRNIILRLLCCRRAATRRALHQTQLTLSVLAVLLCMQLCRHEEGLLSQPCKALLSPCKGLSYVILFRPLLVCVSLCLSSSSTQWLIKGYVCLICRCSCGLNVALILLFLFLAIFNFLAAAGQFVPNCLKASTMTVDHEMRMSCIHVSDHVTMKSDSANWQLITVVCPAILADLL